MTSPAIPPEDERRRALGQFIWNALPDRAANVMGVAESEALAAHVWNFLQHDREAIIEACAKIVAGTVYRERYRRWSFWPGADRHRDSDDVRFADDAAAAIRSLKHSDPTTMEITDVE